MRRGDGFSDTTAFDAPITKRARLRAGSLPRVTVVTRPVALDARANVTVDASCTDRTLNLAGARQDLEGALRFPGARQPHRQRVRCAAKLRMVVQAKAAGRDGACGLALGSRAPGGGAIGRWTTVPSVHDIHVRSVGARKTTP
jgi:hypothetical protein